MGRHCRSGGTLTVPVTGAGAHRFTFRVTILVMEGELNRVQRPHSENWGDAISDDERGRAVHEVVRSVECRTTVLEHEPAGYIRHRRSAELDAAAAASLTVSQVRRSRSRDVDMNALCGTISLTEPLATDFAFAVVAQYDDVEVVLGQITLRGDSSREEGNNSIWVHQSIPGDFPSTVTILLRPSTQAASDTVDVFEIWGGALRFENIAVIPDASGPSPTYRGELDERWAACPPDHEN